MALAGALVLLELWKEHISLRYSFTVFKAVDSMFL